MPTRYRSILRSGPFLAACALLTSCAGPRVVREEGRSLGLEPREEGGATIFAGEGRGTDEVEATAKAFQDAEGQAARSCETRIVSRIETIVNGRHLADVVSFDERFRSEVSSEASAALRGVQRRGERHVRWYSDGSVAVRAAIEVPAEELNPDRLLGRTIERQALESIRSGDLDRAERQYWGLVALRPADGLAFLQLARIEERRIPKDPGARGRALEHLDRARTAARGLAIELEGGKSIDLAAEIERLTPHWDDLLAELARLECSGADPGFGIEALEARCSRSRDHALRFRVRSLPARAVAILWIDDDGLFALDPFGKPAVGAFTMLEGSALLEQSPGTTDGRVRLVALSVGAERAPTEPLADIGRAAVDGREPGALGALSRFRALLEAESRAGTLRVATAAVEMVP